jgi:Cu2+-exporting ATPase
MAVALREQAQGVLCADEAHEVLGGGVRARVAGHTVVVGNQRFVEASVGAAERFSERANALSRRGLSPVFIAVDGEMRAVAGLGDPVRPEARACLLELQRAGHRLAISSGDDSRVVQSVKDDLGVDFVLAHGEQSPEQKLEFVRAERARGRVIRVGDGVNDAAALTLADVGIAVAGGAEASLAAADVFATTRGLLPIVELVRGAARTMWLVRTNLAFSLSYNTVAAALALTGHVHPLLAAILMPLSSLTVVVNTLRYRCFVSDEPESGPRPHTAAQEAL